MGEFPERDGMNFFELLPLHVKMEVIKDYRVVFGERTDISYYFYSFRNVWEDQERRMERNRFDSVGDRMEKLGL